MRKHWLAGILALSMASAASSCLALECSGMGSWLNAACQRVDDTFSTGTPDLYFSGYTWHDPATYDEDKRKTFNDHAWGLGFGRHTTDAQGNDDIVYGMVFSDSHYKPELLTGYARLWFAPVAGQLSVAAGYTAGLTSRRDIFGGIPFPIVLPLAAVRYDKLSVMGTFIPKVGGGFNHGNVAFFFGRYEY